MRDNLFFISPFFTCELFSAFLALNAARARITTTIGPEVPIFYFAATFGTRCFVSTPSV